MAYVYKPAVASPLWGGGRRSRVFFAFSAIAENWWRRYDRAGWDEFPVPVLGASRGGPYAQNAFIRYLDSPFRLFSDTDGEASAAFELLTDREGVADTSCAVA